MNEVTNAPVVDVADKSVPTFGEKLIASAKSKGTEVAVQDEATLADGPVAN